MYKGAWLVGDIRGRGVWAAVRGRDLKEIDMTHFHLLVQSIQSVVGILSFLCLPRYAVVVSILQLLYLLLM